MDKSTTSSMSCSTKSTTSIPNNLITIPVHGNLAESFDQMNQEQINYNLLQLNLVSMYNEDILNKLYHLSKNTKFYLRNRYVLEKLINCVVKPHPKQKPLKQIVQKYDTVYVNGMELNNNSKVKDILKGGFKKQHKARFISNREEFISYLDTLSLTLKQKQQQLTPEQLRAYYQVQLCKINSWEAHAIVSPNKKQLIQSFSVSSSSDSESVQVEQISQSSADSPKKQQKSTPNIFTICFKNTIQNIKELNIPKCSFINTKNRCPLVLDFGFARFIYKNDDQLSHQLIAMHLMHYINKIISVNDNSSQIVQYQIIPEAYGALYEYVQNSITVHQIKKKYKGGIPEYLNFLQSKNLQDSQVKISSIRKRFAETFCGFSLAQYLLDIKDRNNCNIMIKNDGSIFHIDLAFIFNAAPGGINFQSCPFKFTKEYLKAMGGFDSDCFKHYEVLMMSSLTKLCLNRQQFLTKINYLSARREEIRCFKKFKFSSYESKIPKRPEKVKECVEKIISDSFDNWRTTQYDDYQFNTNNILK